MAWKAKFFQENEMQCHCCRKNDMNQKFMDMLDLLRYTLNEPVYVNSGFRCPAHNKSVKGAPGSFHTQGKASDIRCKKATPAKIAEVALKLGFGGVHVYETFCHVDIGPRRSW